MNILLFSMPDSFEHTPTLTIRMPNGALASLAGNVDPHHRVAIADLILAQSSVRDTVQRLVAEIHPDVIGLSVMTFQRSTARRVIALVRTLMPEVRVVVGGYDPSLAPEAWTDPAIGVDVIVRGEGDVTFRELIRAFEDQRPLSTVDGIWYRDGGRFRQTPQRAVTHLEPARSTFPTAAPGRYPATRCSDARSTSSKHHAAAHSTAASARSSRCADATSTVSRSIGLSQTSAMRRARRALHLHRRR